MYAEPQSKVPLVLFWLDRVKFILYIKGTAALQCVYVCLFDCLCIYGQYEGCICRYGSLWPVADGQNKCERRVCLIKVMIWPSSIWSVFCGCLYIRKVFLTEGCVKYTFTHTSTALGSKKVKRKKNVWCDTLTFLDN